eukprot:Rhum_TRINITY_DN18551_c0_g2::Rhum_TRINITY_DN18551_c0_g2_i1::g.167505::m.167505
MPELLEANVCPAHVPRVRVPARGVASRRQLHRARGVGQQAAVRVPGGGAEAGVDRIRAAAPAKGALPGDADVQPGPVCRPLPREVPEVAVEGARHGCGCDARPAAAPALRASGHGDHAGRGTDRVQRPHQRGAAVLHLAGSRRGRARLSLRLLPRHHLLEGGPQAEGGKGAAPQPPARGRKPRQPRILPRGAPVRRRGTRTGREPRLHAHRPRRRGRDRGQRGQHTGADVQEEPPLLYPAREHPRTLQGSLRQPHARHHAAQPSQLPDAPQVPLVLQVRGHGERPGAGPRKGPPHRRARCGGGAGGLGVRGRGTHERGRAAAEQSRHVLLHPQRHDARQPELRIGVRGTPVAAAARGVGRVLQDEGVHHGPRSLRRCAGAWCADGLLCRRDVHADSDRHRLTRQGHECLRDSCALHDDDAAALFDALPLGGRRCEEHGSCTDVDDCDLRHFCRLWRPLSQPGVSAHPPEHRAVRERSALLVRVAVDRKAEGYAGGRGVPEAPGVRRQQPRVVQHVYSGSALGALPRPHLCCALVQEGFTAFVDASRLYSPSHIRVNSSFGSMKGRMV